MPGYRPAEVVFSKSCAEFSKQGEVVLKRKIIDLMLVDADQKLSCGDQNLITFASDLGLLRCCKHGPQIALI
jgi:hypothetical protein